MTYALSIHGVMDEEDEVHCEFALEMTDLDQQPTKDFKINMLCVQLLTFSLNIIFLSNKSKQCKTLQLMGL